MKEKRGHDLRAYPIPITPQSGYTGRLLHLRDNVYGLRCGGQRVEGG